jgi:hypothetical protein
MDGKLDHHLYLEVAFSESKKDLNIMFLIAIVSCQQDIYIYIYIYIYLGRGLSKPRNPGTVAWYIGFDGVLLSWVILVLNDPTCKQGMSSIMLCRTESGTEGRSTDILQGPCRIAAGDGWPYEAF